MHLPFRHQNRLPRRHSATLLAVAGGLLLSACASAPEVPTDAIRQAEDAISRAEEARVANYNSDALRQAREKVVQARELSVKATHKRDPDAALQARRLAEQATSDAELATAQAREKKAKEINKGINKNIDALGHEIQRQGGAQ